MAGEPSAGAYGKRVAGEAGRAERRRVRGAGRGHDAPQVGEFGLGPVRLDRAALGLPRLAHVVGAANVAAALGGLGPGRWLRPAMVLRGLGAHHG